MSDGLGGTAAAKSMAQTAKLSPDEVKARKNKIRAFYKKHLADLPIVATTTTDSGRVIDWVPARKDHPAPPPPATFDPSSSKSTPITAPPPGTPQSALTEVPAQPWARGPAGTVPVMRFDVEGHLAAMKDDDIPASGEAAQALWNKKDLPPPPAPDSVGRYYGAWQRTTGGPYYGTFGFINIWNVDGPASMDTSIAQTAVIRPSDPTTQQAIEAGKVETSYLNGGRPKFFVYFRTHGSDTGRWIGGYDAIFKGWQQAGRIAS
jgi:hypothetical protein